MTNAPSDPLIGTLLDGRYQIVALVARGGMATVYEALDRRLARRVAVKIMHGHLAGDDAFKNRFVQEARSAAGLAHPNVVSVFDQGQDAEMAYLIMEYLPGITLRDLLKERGKLSPSQTFTIMRSVLSGLAAAHQAGIIHRDLKPENVMLANDGRIKIADFGLARAATANTASGQALLGTIAYLSPELLMRGHADSRSDIYALGIMMYEMLVGEQPYQGEQPMQIAFQHANEQVPRPSIKNPSIPPEADALVLWATAKEPGDRPANAGEMLTRLDQIRKGGTGVVPIPSSATKPTEVMPAQPVGQQRTQQPFTQAVRPVAPRQPTTSVTRPAPAGQPAASGPPARSARSALSTKTKTRRRRGVVLFFAVLIIALVGAGIGLYFNVGPGAQASVPDLDGLDRSQAESLCATSELECAWQEQPDIDVPSGSVISSQPPAGSRVEKDATVTVLVSTGPQQLEVPSFDGKTLDEATTLAIDSGFTVSDKKSEVFSDEVAAGVVMGAYGSDNKKLGSTYGEKQPIKFRVSLGAVPEVIGLSFDDAAAKLAEAGLEIAKGESAEDREVPEGGVIATVVPEGTIRKGDTITVNLSLGPPQVAIPDVVGMTLTEAKTKLSEVGLVADYNFLADLLSDAYVVSKVDPEVGTSVDEGSSVSISLSSNL